MQCKDIEIVLEQEGLEPLPAEARAHLAQCAECRNYVADVTSIVDGAHKLPAEIAPPDRVWISLRAQLEAEGIIRTPADSLAAPRQSWWEALGAFFSNRVLATASVGILITAAAVFVVRRDRVMQSSQPAIAEANPALRPVPATAPVNRDTTSPLAATTVQTPPAEFASTAQALSDQEPVATGMIASSHSTVDASLRDNLKKVNEFIADCERHLKEQPQDELTREYLSAAYGQKAELLSAIIERGRSVN